MNAILPKRQRGVALQQDVETAIVAMYREGAQRKDIMDRAGVGKSTVSDVLSRNGVVLKSGRVVHDKDKAELAVQMYKDGAERKDITAATGIPNSTLTHVLKRFGVDLTHVRRAGVPSERTQAIRKLWLDGKSQRQIAETLGLSTSAVAGVVYREKLKRDPAINAANLKRANRKRYPRPKSDPKPTLVAVASHDDSRVLMVPEAEAAKYAGRESTPQILTSAEDPVIKLRALDCRWPIGNPGTAGFRFCCGLRSGAGSYCAEHDKASRSKVTVSDKELIRNLRRFA